MAAAIQGDPQKDADVKEAMEHLQRVLCKDGTIDVDPEVFRNLDQKMLRDLSRLCGRINVEAIFWCDVRNEQ